MANLNVRSHKVDARSPPTVNINPDIAEERRNAKFDPVELTYVIDGGKEKTERRRFLESEALNDPAFDDPMDISFMTDEQRHSNSVRKAIQVVRRTQELEISNPMELIWFRGATNPLEVPSLSLHTSMFMTTIINQMTLEQRSQWESAAKKFELIGTYAQTELGHGTYQNNKIISRRSCRKLIFHKQGRIQGLPRGKQFEKYDKQNIKKRRLSTVMEDISPMAVHKAEEPALALHSTMFSHAILSQMSDDQHEKWLNAAFNFVLLGTYAQTELGHGTFLRGLETTATYDPRTQEFEIHSPTLTSMKWWPGNLGKTVTHAIVAAQLYTKGHCMGVHMFMVPLRSLETHLPHPGVELGDIGPKFGYNNIDNGFLRFNHYRIPRENMCMRHSQVMPDGTYVPPPHKKVSYGSMLPIRSGIVGNTGWALAKGCIIATRYSVVRRQSELIPGTKEAKILDYQSQQLKIIPNIATSFAFILTGKQMMKTYFDSLAEMNEGNFSSLPELHATSAGLKAFTSAVVASSLEELRMSCGGHGYSKASGFPELYTTAVPATTYEGENTVMFLQTARYLMKVARQVGSGNKLVGCAAYLQSNLSPRCLAKRQTDFLRQDILVDAYKHRAKSVVMLAAKRMGEEIKKGHSQPIAWNNCHMYLIKAAMAHCHLYCVESFFDGVNSTDASQPAVDALMALCQLYAIFGISQNKGDLLQDGYMIGEQLDMLERQLIDLLAIIRPIAVTLVDFYDIYSFLCFVLIWFQDGYMNGEQLDILERQLIDLLAIIRPIAVTLVDSYDIPDKMLSSVLGRYDGNVYENLYEWAKKAPLNKKEVPAAYEVHWTIS
nr:peroxisomal acyl-coenzyme A oxidase 1-like [Lytechinus pictus]